MSARSADRNLLLGVLALQMNFISREQLVAAVSAWVLDKSQPLETVLVKHGALQDDTRDLLDALVRKHLSLHGGDPERSLAAVSAVAPAREELERVADADVRASLRRVAPRQPMPAADPFPQGGHLATQTPAVGVSTSSGLRFRILRPHAKGGLGEVLIAHDGELQREVALKQIQDRYADHPDSRARFVLEAEITGALEHPCIVPVYGLGTYGDGRPYYAMRFIRGDSLKEAIHRFHQSAGDALDPGERSLELRKLLGRFIDVCNAIAYAHSRGVLHRDLKPGNVMLGKYGETLVVDWGLAKPIDQQESGHFADERPLQPSSQVGSAATQMGSAVGTPAYMSPEQAAGRLDVLSVASDVYSLGATLYSLLTGQPPFEASDLGVVLQRVQRGEFRPPREVKKDIPRPLEAICLKAMALKPAERYASPRALADDLEHWLADEPVSAAPETFGERLARWARRHRKEVRAAAASLAGIAIAAVIAAIAINAQRQIAEEQRGIAETERQQAEASQREAEINRGLAEKNAALAEERTKQANDRFNLALDTLNALVFDVQDQLANRAGTQALRERVLLTAQQGLARLVANADRSLSADETAIASHRGMGDVCLLLGQTKRAAQEYDTALRLAKAWADADPTNKDAQHSLTVSYNKVGVVNLRLGNIQAAQSAFDSSLLTSQQLALAHPDHPGAQRDVSVAQERVGDVNLQRGNIQAARRAYETGLEISRRLAATDPANAQYKRDLSVCYGKVGDVSLQLGDITGAREAYEAGLAISQELAGQDRENTESQRDPSIFLEKLGNVSLQTGDPAAAHKSYEQSLAIRRPLAERDPGNSSAQRDLSGAYNKLGDVALQLGDTAAARKAYEDALAIVAKLAESDRENVQAQRDLSIAYGKLGDVSLQLSDPAAAKKAYASGLEIRQRLADRNPESLRAQIDLVAVFDRLGRAEQLDFEFARAAEWYEKGEACMRRLEQQGKLQDQPEFAKWLKTLEDNLAASRRDAQAVEDLNFALQQDAAIVPKLLHSRAVVLVRRGEHALAAETAEKLSRLDESDIANAYVAADAYALCLAAVAAGKTPEQLTPEDRQAQQRYAARAVELLKVVEASQYFADPANRADLKSGADFAALRERPEFQQWLQAVESKANR